MFTCLGDHRGMRKSWLTRVIESFADAGSLVGMPPATIELMILEERERVAAEVAARRAAGNEGDEGDGGSRFVREPVAA
jgi:hypothetical protein